MDGWMNSSGHKANILKPNYQHVGFGKTASTDKWNSIYWVQDFGADGTC